MTLETLLSAALFMGVVSMDDIAQIAAGLTEKRQALILAIDGLFIASEIAPKVHGMNSYQIGKFAAQSPLFERVSRNAGHVSVWRLSSKGLAVAQYLRSQGNG